jgi:hypothetical protein
MVFIKLGTLAFVVPITKRENIELTYGIIFYNLTFVLPFVKKEKLRSKIPR